MLSTLLPLVHASLSAPQLARPAHTVSSKKLRLAVVGDVHGEFEEDDNAALINLAPDAVLLVGDFGNEDVGVVRSIARLQESLPCATIFGNHDICHLSKRYRKNALPNAAFSALPGGVEGAATQGAAPQAGSSFSALPPRLGLGKEYNAVREMHALLKPSACAWGRLDLSDLGLAVAGGRPFSSGGGDHTGHKQSLYKDLFDIGTVEESASRIAEAVDTSPAAVTVVMAHNGPTGLGCEKSDICGRDWEVSPRRGKARDVPRDWGDADLEMGLAACTTRVPLVVFGHMHAALRDGGTRTMAVERHGRLYVNAAHVPRWRDTAKGRERAFTLIELALEQQEQEEAASWAASSAEKVWALPTGEIAERRSLWPPHDVQSSIQ